MFVIVVGGGKTGSQLCTQLRDEGHSVKVIENRESVLERLKVELPDDIIVPGDGSSPSVLESAGIEKANVLAAVTGEDEANLVITSLARFEYKVPRTIARVNNPKNAWLFNQDMGVDVALSQPDILAKLIAEEMSLGDMMTLLKLRRGEYSVIEEKVHPTSIAAGKAIRDIELPTECVLVAILRQGRLIVPRGDIIINPVDEIIALVHGSQLANLAKILAKQ